MTDYFAIRLPEDDIRAISSIGLAHIGDGVYELLVRTYLCAHGKATGKGLHRATVELVCAPEQARRARKLLPLLTEPQRSCPFHSPARQPRGVSAGHGPGGAAWLAVS